LSYGEQVDYREVPDPYYSGEDGFELVLDLVEQAAAGLLADIRTRYCLA
ncbi:MAG: low molecular weight phosphotyrosine protein phosphatase, partial [Porticoccaceae bacterium]|nr:low molecular weight phosphotyrosine protein phosphatase [Porticoccaceae bacterium]